MASTRARSRTARSDDESFATKGELRRVEGVLSADIRGVETKLTADIRGVEERLSAEIREVRGDIRAVGVGVERLSTDVRLLAESITGVRD